MQSFVVFGLPALTSAGVLWADVCTQEDVKDSAWCDTSSPVEQRAAAFVAALRPEEKVPIMTNEASGVSRLHIPPYQWGSEGLHGPKEPCVCDEAQSCACPTSFPAPSAMGSAWNESLYHLVGKYDGLEARAINNLRNHVTQNNYGDGLDYWSPTINMQRDPRWGRNQEVPGEEPKLTSLYAKNFVRGLQGEDAEQGGSASVTIAACCKHFIANSLEGWNGNTRHNFNAEVAMQDLVDYYEPAFKTCVTEGHSRGIMCSYNAVNGVPMCANPAFLNDTLRGDWGFKGYVTSDCDAVGDVYDPEPNGHGFANATWGTALSLKAGTDMDCGDWGKHAYINELPGAIDAGYVDQSDLDRALLRLTTLQMELGLFDPKPPQPLFNLGVETIHAPEHTKLALEAAQQSIVLLKNDASILPLKPGQNIAVIGPHHDGNEVFLSNYHGDACIGGGFKCIESPLQAIMKANVGGNTTGLLGCSVKDNSTDDTKAAVALAKESDVAVLVMGIDGSVEGESKDRYQTTLPGLQTKLLSAVLASGTPVVLVLVHGGIISLGDIRQEFEGKHAVVDAFYGGEMAAPALSSVLFGEFNPTGRLAVTVYPPEFVDQLPMTNMNLSAPPGRTHMYYSGTPEFAFGDGLSYTSFEVESHGETQFTFSTKSGSAVEIAARVRNTGSRVGGATVFAFWRPTSSLSNAPALRQKLLGFKKVLDLAPGSETVVRLDVAPEDLAVANTFGDRVIAPGDYEIVFKVASDQVVSSHQLKVTGVDRIVEARPRFGVSAMLV